MKKVLIRFLILIAWVCVSQGSCVSAQTQHVEYSVVAIQTYNAGIAFHKQGKYELAEQKYIQTLKLQPNFVEAKQNLAIIYQNLSCKYYGQEAYSKSIYYAQKSLALKPNNVYCYNTIANCYMSLRDDEKLIAVCNKIISITPDDDLILGSLAGAYIKTNQLDKASEIYKKILIINPNDKIAQQNLKYANFTHSEKILNESINKLNIGHVAPEKLYKLINLQSGVDYSYLEKMKTILDFIWSEPNGKMLLSALLEKNTPINITSGYAKANAYRTHQTRTFYLYGIIPIASFTTNSSVAVNLPFSHIDNFNNSNLPANQRIYNLQVFMHEFGHAFIGIKNPKDVNSIEEEMGVSMIGYNIANKIITGKYLDFVQAETYSTDCLIGLLSDEHRDLPVYSGFNQSIQRYGVVMPYPEVYSNLPLMYKKLLSEGKVASTPTFSAYMNKSNQ